MLGLFARRHYKVWRTFDRQIWTPSKFVLSQGNIKASPLRMIKVFGPPDRTQNIDGVSGVYDFEDENFDVFRVHDMCETSEKTSQAKQLRRHPPMRMRNKRLPLPSTEDFWNSTEVASFRVTASSEADAKSFLKWAREMIEADEDMKKKVMEKFGPIQGQNEFGKTYPIEAEFSFFKHNQSTWETVEKTPKPVASKSKKDKKSKDSSEVESPKTPPKIPKSDTPQPSKPEADTPKPEADPLKPES